MTAEEREAFEAVRCAASRALAYEAEADRAWAEDNERAVPALGRAAEAAEQARQTISLAAIVLGKGAR